MKTDLTENLSHLIDKLRRAGRVAIEKEQKFVEGQPVPKPIKKKLIVL